MSGCKHCQNGFLDNRFGQDVECVNGVLIDIDVAHEGWARDEAYPPAPCMACPVCGGAGEEDGRECLDCDGTGWRDGDDQCQERLKQWAAP